MELSAVLSFDIDENDRDGAIGRNLWILHDYLIEESVFSGEDASSQILGFLPETPKGQADFGWGLSVDIMHMAKCIPPKHPSMSRLLDLILIVYTSDKWRKDAQIDQWERLGWASRDCLNDMQTALEKEEREEQDGFNPDDIRPDLQYRNYNAFNAYLKNLVGWSEDKPDWWALFQLTRALEVDEEDMTGLGMDSPLCDAHALAAAQWILIDGQNLHQLVLEAHQDIANFHDRGGLWTAQARKLSSESTSQGDVCKMRWKFWKERFEALASGERDDEFSYAGATKESAREAVEYMGRLEDDS